MASASRDCYRAGLTTAVAAMVKEAAISQGYTDIEPLALESLVEITQSFITQMGKSSKHYSEVASRSQVMVTDISLALIDSGINLVSLKTFSEKRLRRSSTVLPPSKEAETKVLLPLSVNPSTVQPAYVHEHLPQFPDRHTYIQTAAQRLPTTDYQSVRQKASVQRKNTETALTKFTAKTGEADYYCDDADVERHAVLLKFPLIACKPSPLTYLSALLPKDESEYEVFDLKEEQDASGVAAVGKRVTIDPNVEKIECSIYPMEQQMDMCIAAITN